jgi:hypothetical protein
MITVGEALEVDCFSKLSGGKRAQLSAQFIVSHHNSVN